MQLEFWSRDQHYEVNPSLHINADSGVISLNKPLLKFLQIDPDQDGIEFTLKGKKSIYVGRAVSGSGTMITKTHYGLSFQLKSKELAKIILRRTDCQENRSRVYLELNPQFFEGWAIYKIYGKSQKTDPTDPTDPTATN